MNRLFGIFNVIAIIATTYGNGIIPAIQVWNNFISLWLRPHIWSIKLIVVIKKKTHFLRLKTLAPPIKGKMLKGLCVCYLVLIVTFFSVSVSGYWAFGNESEGLILSNFVDNGKPLVPKWFIYMTNILIITQLSAVGVVSDTLTLCGYRPICLNFKK